MDPEEKITQYVLDRYRPKAIILIGSRASNEATEFSDWDIAVFIDRPSTNEFIEHDGYFLDIECIELPVADDFVLKLSFAPDPRMKVLFDTDDFAKKVIDRTKIYYLNGPPKLTEEEYNKKKNKLHRLLQKVLSRSEDEGFVFNYIGAIYEIGIRNWFELRQEWSQPLYKALPYIRTHDPKTSELLNVIQGKTSTEEKIEAGKKFYGSLFSKDRLKQ